MGNILLDPRPGEQNDVAGLIRGLGNILLIPGLGKILLGRDLRNILLITGPGNIFLICGLGNTPGTTSLIRGHSKKCTDTFISNSTVLFKGGTVQFYIQYVR